MDIQYYDCRKISNLKEMLQKSKEDYRERSAFQIKVSPNEFKEVTYHEFSDEVDALGTAFIHMGLKDRHVAILSENRYEWVVSYLAVVNGTGVVVPIDRDLPEEAIAYLLEAGDVEGLLYSKTYEDILSKFNLPKIKCFVCFDQDVEKKVGLNKRFTYKEMVEKGRDMIESGDRSFIDAKINEDKMASILFTSGTTGFSKGVMLSHHNMATNIMGTTSIESYYDHDVMLSILPYHHAYECTIGLMASLTYGATICINDSLKYLAKNMQLFRPTCMFLVPAIVNALYKRILEAEKGMNRKLTGEEVKAVFGGRLKRIYSGSAPMKIELIQLLKGYGIQLCQGYGLTETSPTVSTMRYDCLNEKNMSSVGVPIPGCKVKIVDGEIWVSGDNVMLGYYKNQQATEETMEDGWLKTGDLGYLDEEGFLYVNGRKKNVIIASGGENVYPEEIEQFLYGIPFIMDAMVYGGEEGEGNVVTAVIHPNYEALSDKNEVEIEEMVKGAVERVNEKLPIYKQIVDVKIRKVPFQKTTSNKVKRIKENRIAP